MKVIDYGRIAETYDELPIRRVVPIDPLLGELAAARRARVLDVGAGTGNWLEAHARALGDRVELVGVDPSEPMLARARQKLSGVPLVVASAEALPFPDRSFDYVVSRFAFHHFTDKPRALDELTRVVAPGGALMLANIVPERMPGWWVFARFPETRAENARYWELSHIGEAVARRGFSVTVSVDERRSEISFADALAQARTRDQSHLSAIEDDAWERGVRALERDHAADPHGSMPTEMVVMRLVGRRS